MDFKNALELNHSVSNSSSLFYSIGLAETGLKNYRQAIIEFTRSINIYPHYLPYESRAFAKSKLKDFRSAIRDYSNAIELNPNNGLAFLNRGYCRLNLGKRELACLDFSKAGELGQEEAYKAIQNYCQ